MAGSRRNPLMKDQWRADDDHKERDHHSFPHPRDRDREKDRERDRERPDRRPRSPPPSRRGAGRGHERSRGRGASFANNNPSSRRPPAAGRRGDHKKQNNHRNRRFSPSSHNRAPDTDQRDSARQPPDGQVSSRTDQRSSPPLSPAPPFKRKRSRSISLSRPQHHPRPKRRDGRNRDRPERGRGRPDRISSPKRHPHPGQRGKDSRQGDRGEVGTSEFFSSRRGRSRSPDSFVERRSLSPRRFSRSPPPPRGHLDHSPRPSSRHSILSGASRQSPPPKSRKATEMQSTRHIQSIVDGDSHREPSPLRPIPSFDAANPNHTTEGDSRMRDTFSMHPMRGSDTRGSRRPTRPQVDTRQSYGTSPQYVTPTSSHHGSPQSGSPFSGSRGSWGSQQPYQGQQGQMSGYSPPYRQGTYPPPQGSSQGQYYQSQQAPYSAGSAHGQPGYSGQPYRGAPPGYRGNQYNQVQDRRFSAPGPHQQPPQQQQQQQRGRGSHFNNLQWTPSSGRGRGSHGPQGGPPHMSDERMSPEIDEDDNPFRPSKDLQVEDEDSKPKPEKADAKKMPPPNRQQSSSSQPKESGKFSFAFKSKAPAPATPKPVPDLATRMREPPPRAADTSKNKQSSAPPPRDKHRDRSDRRDDRRDSRRNDRRFDHRDNRHRDRREDRRMEARHERRPERSPERKKPKKIMKRMKPRPTIPEEFSQSDSVYYRKPGNESVIGAGTYGKVFKAIHVYTKNMVALKKIRMEGEKDGFPITAVREIRLLQHLRHDNVVSLQEVMVEKNECFMVFEYLSHDLTGLINHPSFSLSPAHKKHLARQMFEGLNYLHHRGVLHRDIKAANILISNQGQLKFADFGLARFFSKSRQLDYTNRVITIWYRPPELLLGETRYGPAVDIWSAACVWVEMFTKKSVFPGEGGEISQLDKLYNSLGTPTRHDWPDIVEMPWFELLRPTERRPRTFEDVYKDFLSPAALDLVGKMFQYDPAKRPSAEEVLTHTYFTSEEPAPLQATELSTIEGDWHEFESKAHRKEKDKEARRAEHQREKEKRRVSAGATQGSEGRDTKRARLDEDASNLQSLEN
ncbi:CMGC/CDK/CRK7 protein kinase [Helicocarpus griseus UAMH5409]|uniref:cyclin-dependent kinase n=1 Tax=Helicocarpus griseus UAMH5409 TaxID=1447875 RepID=A0A2B7XSI7_9EURO|nr:CMGC/CDK/CRK7 protein kinase [Helicocarpus griseus UAMH5409]